MIEEIEQIESLDQLPPTYLTFNDALAYLQQKYPRRRISRDRLYQRLYRSKQPYKKIMVGRTKMYVFTREELDAMRFYTQRRRKRRVRKIEPMQIRTARDITVLQRKYGPLVNDDGLLDLLEKEFGVQYSPHAIKQRRSRNRLKVVGIEGGNRQIHWYAVNQLRFADFSPARVKVEKGEP